MRLTKFCISAIIFFGAFNGFSQDIIQKLDNSVISCKVVEISESSVIYKLWDQLSGPNRSLARASIVKIVYENGQIEFFNEKESTISKQTISTEAPAVKNGTSSDITQSTGASDEFVKPELEGLNYAPLRVTAAFNSLGYFSLGIDGESKIISDYVNIGFGYWGHTFSNISDYTYYSFRAYTSIYAPINKLSGKLDKVNRGFFPFFQPGADMVIQFPEEGGTNFSAVFFWRVGADYYLTDKFGISYSFSQGSLNNIGISWRW
ncbi:MAG: hypothetical protein ABJ333_08550 [Algoriphagus sp.]|uniref:hypothetical protein n=1 Tax=Algoriphagus sp. TaxID=1872435 RepID=UPI003298FD32